MLSRELGLDGRGQLLDVGCGPGVLAIQLGELFEEVTALDPDPEMLAEGRRLAKEAGLDRIRWIQAVAEEIPSLAIGPCRLVTLGQSFHWTDRELVAESVYDLLEPGGAIALVAHTRQGRPKPPDPGHPPVPHDEIRALVSRYLGERARAGQGYSSRPCDHWEDALSRTRFGRPRSLFAPGQPDIVQDVSEVASNQLSHSSAAPHLFGDRLDAFLKDLRSLLDMRSPSGLFWEWPGDTEVVLARKPV